MQIASFYRLWQYWIKQFRIWKDQNQNWNLWKKLNWNCSLTKCMKSDEMFCLILFIIVILLTTAVFWLRLLQSLSIFFKMLSNSPKLSLNFNSKFNLNARWVWSRLKMGLLAWFCSLLLMQNDRNLPKPWMKLYGRAKKKLNSSFWSHFNFVQFQFIWEWNELFVAFHSSCHQF